MERVKGFCGRNTPFGVKTCHQFDNVMKKQKLVSLIKVVVCAALSNFVIVNCINVMKLFLIVFPLDEQHK